MRERERGKLDREAWSKDYLNRSFNNGIWCAV